MGLFQTLRDEGYLDEFGLVTPKPDGIPDENGILFTSEAIRCSWVLGEQDAGKFQAADAIVKNCMIYPGLYKRSPHIAFDEQFDDYEGLLSAFYLLSPGPAEDVYKYAIANDWCFNNVEPGKFSFKSWLGRSPGFRFFVKLCARVKPNLFERLCFLAGFMGTILANKGDTNNRLTLGMQMFVVKLDDHPISQWCAKTWETHLMAVYGSNNCSLKPLLEIYFGKEHPIARFWPS